MIDPEQPDRTACPMMLRRGPPEETGGCIGRPCGAFRWIAWNPDDLTLQTHISGPEAAVRAGVEQYRELYPNIKVMGYCGMVGWP